MAAVNTSNAALQVGTKVRLLSSHVVQNVEVSEIQEMGPGRAWWKVKGGSLMDMGTRNNWGPEITL